jgi:hypothetical protein
MLPGSSLCWQKMLPLERLPYSRHQNAYILPKIFLFCFFHILMEALLSCEMPVLTSTTRRHIPENEIPHSRSLDNLKSNKAGIVLPITMMSLCCDVHLLWRAKTVLRRKVLHDRKTYLKLDKHEIIK